MIEEKTLIENYVSKVLPKSEVTKYFLYDNTFSHELIFDAKACVSFGKGRQFTACFLIKNSSPSLATFKNTISMLRLVDTDETAGCVKILLTEYLSKKRQEMLRENGIGFIDSVGNAWVDSENLLIDRRGNKPVNTSSQGRIQSVFSDKATLVSRLLLYSGARGIREISTMLDRSGFSLTPGYVSKVANSLIAENYAKRTEKGIELVNKELFLEDWVDVYKRKRVQREIERWYYPSAGSDDLARMVGSRVGESGVLTDRAGTFFIDPYASFESIDVLVRDKDSVVEILKDIGAKPVDRGANINVIKPYYSISSFFGSQEIEGVHVASDIQLYLDLSHQPKRGLEAAEHLYQQRILPTIEKD